MAIGRAIDSVRNSVFDRRTHCGALTDPGRLISLCVFAEIVQLKFERMPASEFLLLCRYESGKPPDSKSGQKFSVGVYPTKIFIITSKASSRRSLANAFRRPISAWSFIQIESNIAITNHNIGQEYLEYGQSRFAIVSLPQHIIVVPLPSQWPQPSFDVFPF